MPMPDLAPKDLSSPPNPGNGGNEPERKTAVEPPVATTKDCVQVGYDCRNKTYNTIQIPLDADCNDYQPAMPQCAGPRGGGDMMMVAPEMLYQNL
jgi:hypothetical protein